MNHSTPADAERISELVGQLNRCRHEYYNLAKPSVTDAVYDRLFDELAALERKTGVILANSPTQTVGYTPVSSLAKVRHPIPLLSMDKTKQVTDLVSMSSAGFALLMLKLDGLTVKLCYENGELVEASTRGNGEVGENITHNIPAFCNVPLKIPHKGKLTITGEGLIHTDDFERMKDAGDKEIATARNLAAGSIRLLDPSVCKDRCVYFYAFNVLEGMDKLGINKDSRGWLLEDLEHLGFDICPFVFLPEKSSQKDIEQKIAHLRRVAELEKLPIDGMVLRYNSLRYSRSLGRTDHHYKDGIAFKFEDDTYETVFRSIEWQPGRSGELAPVALFDAVEIDGCTVSRASLHNISFIKDLELHPGCRVLVSKRNMIIPHIEDNLDRGHYDPTMIPERCPCCGKRTSIRSRMRDKGKIVETLLCDDADCFKQIVRKFVHFAGKKAMDISGLSEATLERFVSAGFLTSFQDLYHLDRHRDEIIRMEGFGAKSYLKRTDGNSVVGFASYCSGNRLRSQYDGRTHYHNRVDVVFDRVLLPQNAPDEFHDREILWNAVETLEGCRGQLARAIDMGLPVELSREDQIELTLDYVQRMFVDRGMCADIAIHDKENGNPHAHVILTLRGFDSDGSWLGKWQKNYLLDEYGEKIYDSAHRRYKCGPSIPVNDWGNRENAELWRSEWAAACNRAMERIGSRTRYTHLSYARRGSRQKPQRYMGRSAWALEARGFHTDRGDENRRIREEQRQREEKRQRSRTIERFR